MYRRRRDSEISLHVRFGGRPSIDQGVCSDECEILPLQGGEARLPRSLGIISDFHVFAEGLTTLRLLSAASGFRHTKMENSSAVAVVPSKSLYASTDLKPALHR